MNKAKAIEIQMKTWSTADLIAKWNEMCEDKNYSDDMVYNMEDFDEYLNDMTQSEGAWWLACRVFYGGFNPSDDYFMFNGYGNLISFDYWEDEHSPICISELAEWAADGRGDDWEIDEEELMDAFIEEYYPNNDAALHAVHSLHDDCTDFFEEDWDDIKEEVEELLKEE